MGCEEGERKICWNSWDNIYLPRKLDGLRIVNIFHFNGVLITKWKWELMQERGGMRCWCGGWRGLQCESSIRWRDLCNTCGSSRTRKWFDSSVEWNIVRGDKIMFWSDNWWEKENLAQRYPYIVS